MAILGAELAVLRALRIVRGLFLAVGRVPGEHAVRGAALRVGRARVAVPGARSRRRWVAPAARERGQKHNPSRDDRSPQHRRHHPPSEGRAQRYVVRFRP